MEQGEVERFISEERIRGIDGLGSDVLRLLGARFNVQVVIVGIVSDFTYVTTSEPTPVVGVTTRLVDPRNGRLLWSCTRTREGSDGETVFGMGRIQSLSRLSEAVLDGIADELAGAAGEIADLLEHRGGAAPVIGPIGPKTEGAGVPTAGSDEERDEVRRAVRRHWEMIKKAKP